MTIPYILSQIFILISYIFLIMTYQSKNRTHILKFNFCALVATAISYVFLSAYSGLAMTIIAIIRNIIFIIDEKKNGKNNKNGTKDYIILAVLYTISIISAIFTYNGILSMMSVAATMLYTYSVWQKSTKVYKILGIPVEIIWLIYNIYIMSIFGIVMEVVLAISAIIGYIKETKKKNMNLEYKKIEEKDKKQLFNLIDTVLKGLENSEYFIPYEQWEFDSMFDEKNYAPLYGAYDKEKLVRNGSVIHFSRYALGF